MQPSDRILHEVPGRGRPTLLQRACLALLRLLGWTPVVAPSAGTQGRHHRLPAHVQLGFHPRRAVPLRHRAQGQLDGQGLHVPLAAARLVAADGRRAINRRAASGFIGAAVQQYRTTATGCGWRWRPEGTRSHTDHLKSGFYQIALGADVPCGLGFIDYPSKTLGIARYVRFSGDADRTWRCCATSMRTSADAFQSRPATSGFAAASGCSPGRALPEQVFQPAIQRASASSAVRPRRREPRIRGRNQPQKLARVLSLTSSATGSRQALARVGVVELAHPADVQLRAAGAALGGPRQRQRLVDHGRAATPAVQVLSAHLPPHPAEVYPRLARALHYVATRQENRGAHRHEQPPPAPEARLRGHHDAGRRLGSAGHEQGRPCGARGGRRLPGRT
jgi:hypothetical protein